MPEGLAGRWHAPLKALEELGEGEVEVITLLRERETPLRAGRQCRC